jgi:hypothetical protein
MITVLRILPQKDDDYGNSCFIVGQFIDRETAYATMIKDFALNYSPANPATTGGHIEFIETK